MEGLHSFYKREIAKRAPMLRGRGLAVTIGLFFEFLELYWRMRAWGQHQGHSMNTYRRDIVDSALQAARAMPGGAVRVLDAAAGSCMVQASSGVAGEYMVQSALGVNPMCTCPVARGGMFCKPFAAGMLDLGVSELVIRQLRGILPGTDKGYARAAQLAEQHAAAPSAPTSDSGCNGEAASEAARAAQVAPAPHAAPVGQARQRDRRRRCCSSSSGLKDTSQPASSGSSGMGSHPRRRMAAHCTAAGLRTWHGT